MGEFSMTCSISGLGISGGTAVRCLLLTASPYGSMDARRVWLVRTPPLRAVYNSYGSIEDVHADDKFIADLWLRGLREDLMEKGLGDNSVHDVPTSKAMSFGALLDAVRSGRLEVRQDAKHFWRRPFRLDVGPEDLGIDARDMATPSLRRIETVIAQDLALTARFPEPVSAVAATNKFVVDVPVPHLVRVRFGYYQHGKEHLTALIAARTAVERAGFVGVVAAGSGRYADDAELLVLPAPNAEQHVRGPQWDMATGQSAADDKQLAVAMAMVREDVWQAIAHYPHSDSVYLSCTNCGQKPSYHAKGLGCPNKSFNGQPFKKHAKGTRYEHDPVFPDGVEHVVVQRDYGETVWFGLAAFQAGTRATWQAVLDHFSDQPKPKKKRSPERDAAIDGMMRTIEAARKKESARVAKLPAEERAKLKVEQKLHTDAWEANELDRKTNPRFGDFLITDGIVPDHQPPGAWLFRDSVPGVIGVSEHLSMCLADKLEVPLSVLDALAELSVVCRVIAGIGVTLKPAASTGPQCPEWSQHLRFSRTVTQLIQAEETEEAQHRARYSDIDDAAMDGAYATLAEVQLHVRQK